MIFAHHRNFIKTYLKCLAVGCASILVLLVLVYLMAHQKQRQLNTPEFLYELTWASGRSMSFFSWLIVLPLSSLILTVSIAMATHIRASKIRYTVTILRSMALALALVFFFEPIIQLKHIKTEPNTVAVLIDQSLSMALPFGNKGEKKESLFDKARHIIHASKTTFDKLKATHRFEVHGFSHDVQTFHPQKNPSTIDGSHQSRLFKALTKIRDKYTSSELAGVVVISDGFIDDSHFDDKTGLGSPPGTNTQVPIHAIKIEAPPQMDLSVDSLQAAAFAFVRTVSRFHVKIKAVHLTEDANTTVELLENGTLIRQKNIFLPKNKHTIESFFDVVPPQQGSYLYTVNLVSPGGERTLLNNSNTIEIKAVRDKIRILHVAGRPSWDVRSLRGMLKQNSNIDLVSFFILRTPNDLQLAHESELSLIPFPTRELFEEELESFDVVILQNFDFMPYGMFRYLKNIREFAFHGGGFVMGWWPIVVYRGTIPKHANTRSSSRPTSKESFNHDRLDDLDFGTSLHAEGAKHPITSFLKKATSKNLNLNLDLRGLNSIDTLKPKASPLLMTTSTHPNAHNKPLAVAGRFGEGRTLAVMTDSLWMWDKTQINEQSNSSHQYYDFWDRSIRWLIDDPSLSSLSISTDKKVYLSAEIPQFNITNRYNEKSTAHTSVKITLIEFQKGVLFEKNSRLDEKINCMKGYPT